MIDFWIVRPTVGRKIGLMYVSDVCGWSIRLGLGRRILCAGVRGVPKLGAMPEKGEFGRTAIIGRLEDYPVVHG